MGDDEKPDPWERKFPKRESYRSRSNSTGRYVTKKNAKSETYVEKGTGKKKPKKETNMPKGNDGDRYVVKHDDGWAVKKENAQRPSNVYGTQKEAIDRARQIVEKTSRGNGEVRIQGRDGRFRDSDSGSRNESKAKDKK